MPLEEIKEEEQPLSKVKQAIFGKQSGVIAEEYKEQRNSQQLAVSTSGKIIGNRAQN